jgi:hypothetical protein
MRASTVLSHLRGKCQAPLAAPRRALERLWTSAISKGGYTPGEVFQQLLHYLHEHPSTPILLPAKAVLNTIVPIVLRIGNGRERNNIIVLRFLPIPFPERQYPISLVYL